MSTIVPAAQQLIREVTSLNPKAAVRAVDKPDGFKRHRSIEFDARTSKWLVPALEAMQDIRVHHVDYKGKGRATVTWVSTTVADRQDEPLSGVLVQMDDFFVTLRDASNTVRVVRRVPGMTITKKDPYEAHHDLLDRISDKQIHDLVAYLVTLR